MLWGHFWWHTSVTLAPIISHLVLIAHEDTVDRVKTRSGDTFKLPSPAMPETRAANRLKLSTSQSCDVYSHDDGLNSHVGSNPVSETQPALPDCESTMKFLKSCESSSKKPRMLRCRKCDGCLADDCGTCCACRWELFITFRVSGSEIQFKSCLQDWLSWLAKELKKLHWLFLVCYAI